MLSALGVFCLDVELLASSNADQSDVFKLCDRDRDFKQVIAKQ